jgi:hypothetical protein
VGGHEPLTPGAALSAEPSPTLGLARLLIEFANSHLFLDAASLDELAKAADRFLGRLSIT